jgi:hypothetical protein
MPIKIAPRANISQEFIDGLKAVSKSKLEQIKKDADNTWSDNLKKRMLRDGAVAIGYHKRMLKDPVFFDKELTKLRSLPFQSFGRKHECGRDYLHAVTKDVILKAGSNKYDMGEYEVHIPIVWVQDDNDPIIWSVREPDWETPHPHFFANRNWGSRPTPFERRMSFCWGQFGAVIGAVKREMNIPEYLRILYTYLTRCNPSDLYTGHPSRCRNARFVS